MYRIYQTAYKSLAEKRAHLSSVHSAEAATAELRCTRCGEVQPSSLVLRMHERYTTLTYDTILDTKGAAGFI